VTAKAASEAEARALIAPVEASIRAIAGEYIYGVDEETLEEALGITLRARGLTLAVAESCTGGLLGGRITAVPGSSDYFLGGVISYSNEVKVKLLGVSAATLDAYGAVSAETAIEMATGATRVTGADIGISITGIAGPGGGSAEKPVGTVYIGIAAPGVAPRAIRADLWGDRATIRQRAVQQALLELRRLLTGMENN
ncbi:MAG: nicotinamide-nucleotide amidohydrolase family protein, partial [bacterium]